MTSALGGRGGLPVRRPLPLPEDRPCGRTWEEWICLENWPLKWDLPGSAWTRGTADQNPPGGTDCPPGRGPALLERLDALRQRVVAPLRPQERTRTRPEGGRMPLYSLFEEISGAAGPAHRSRLLGARPLAEEYATALGDPLRRPGAVRADTGDAPMETGRVLKLFSTGALPVRRGSIPCPWTGSMWVRCPGLPTGPARWHFLLGADDGAIPRPPVAGASERRR